MGNFVPSGRRYLLDKKWKRKFGDMTMEMIECDNLKIRAEVSQFARQTFYKETVVPLSLGLWKDDKGPTLYLKRRWTFT